MNDFEIELADIQKKQEEINVRIAKARKEALDHVQKIIYQFGLTAEELSFNPQETPAKKTRKPAAIRYRTPTGIEWTGKGMMKKEFREYLLSQGLTEADRDMFLVSEEDK